MKNALFLVLLFWINVAFAKTSAVLGSVEKHYRSAHSIQMDATKILKLTLLDRESKSDGTIAVKRGGYLRWETTHPNHSLVLADGKFIWLVDYQEGEEEKPNIIKATNPKKSQPHAVVAFLLGEGRISDDFKVIGEKDLEIHLTEIRLKPKKSTEQIKWLTLNIDKEKYEIAGLSFEDLVGNITELKFEKIKFDSEIDSKIFKFTPPKGADVTVLR